MRNFEVQIWVGGNLSLLHMRNLECAIALFAKLRVYFIVWGWRVRWLAFLPFQCVQPFRHSCIWGTFVGVKELKRDDILMFVYIFRLSVGVFAVWRCRAVGGASDGGVKGKPLNNPLKTSVSRLLFCYYLTKRGFLQKSRPHWEWKSLDTSSFLLPWRMAKFVRIITPKKERLCQTSTQMLRSRLQ